MRYYWVIYGYDLNWKDPVHYSKIYESEDMAMEKFKELKKDEKYRWITWRMNRVEVESNNERLNGKEEEEYSM